MKGRQTSRKYAILRSSGAVLVTLALTFLLVAAATRSAAAALDDAPVANDDAYTTNEDAPLTVDAPGVLANDTDEGLPPPPADWTFCANENERCAFAGEQEVRYGADGTFTAPRAFTDGVDCNNEVFGDPIPGVVKHCERRDLGSLSAELVDGPSHGTLTLISDGGFTYTPAADFNGSDSFTYRASDGELDSNVATVTLTVTAVNDPPVASDDAYTTDAETPVSVPAPGVLGNDTDIEGDALTAALADGPSHGTLALDPNGGFTYTPAAGFAGRDSFTYRASDGALESGVATVTLTVIPPNDDFVNRITLPDASGSRTDDTNVGATKEAGEPNHAGNDGGASVWYGWTAPGAGVVTIDTAGSEFDTLLAVYTGRAVDALTLVAENDDVPQGQDATSKVAFEVTAGTEYKIAVDGYGAETGTVDVQWAFALNSAPVPADDAYTTNEDTDLRVDAPGVLANDTDAEGDPLTAALLEQPSHGTVTLDPGGGFFYTPAADFNGTDSFTYRANDRYLRFLNVGTVTLTVTAVEDAPSAKDDAYRTHKDTALTVPAAGVLANDTDVDGDPLTAAPVDAPSHGTLELNGNGGFTYTPAADFLGRDSFTYRASDGGLESGVAIVTLAITPANDDFAERITLPGTRGSRTDDTNVGATKEAGEPDHAQRVGGASVWYGWTAPGDGIFIIDTAGSVDDAEEHLDTLLAVYTGDAVDALTLVNENNDVTTQELTSRVGFEVTAGTEYKIAVDGQTGTVHIRWAFTLAASPPPPPSSPPPAPPPPPPAPPSPPPPSPPPPPPATTTQARCIVPNVKGKTLGRARRLLTARACRLGKVARAYSLKVPRGLVISQSRRAGRVLPRGTKVNVLVSRGRLPTAKGQRR